MLLLKTLFSLVFLTLSVVDATPSIHRDSEEGFRFATKMSLGSGDGRTLSEMDRARASALVNKHGDISITNTLYSYSALVGVGDPPHDYTLLIDTGSSNTWVGANQSRPYIRTKTSVDTGNTFSVSYSANVSGKEYLDTITLSPYLVIENQSIGVATSTNGSFEGLDGILGIGPTNLTSGTVNKTALVPTVMDNLYSQGKILEEVFAIYLVPSSEPDRNGELMFGGHDRRVITSRVDYVPLTNTDPASRYWGVNQSVSYGDQTILSNAAGVIDTGTTSILFATEAFQKYQKLTGAAMDNATGLLALNADQYANLKPLSFFIGDACYDFTPNAQIWPRSLNTVIGGNSSAIYLIVGDLGSQTDLPIDFINGYVFLQRFYTVYDIKHRRIGFARTAHTDSKIN